MHNIHSNYSMFANNILMLSILWGGSTRTFTEQQHGRDTDADSRGRGWFQWFINVVVEMNSYVYHAGEELGREGPVTRPRGGHLWKKIEWQQWKCIPMHRKCMGMGKDRGNWRARQIGRMSQNRTKVDIVTRKNYYAKPTQKFSEILSSLSPNNVYNLKWQIDRSLQESGRKITCSHITWKVQIYSIIIGQNCK